VLLLRSGLFSQPDIVLESHQRCLPFLLSSYRFWRQPACGTGFSLWRLV